MRNRWLALTVLPLYLVACGTTDDASQAGGAVMACTDGVCPPPDQCVNGDCPPEPGDYCCCSWHDGEEFCCCQKPSSEVCCKMREPLSDPYCFTPGLQECQPPSWWPDWLGGEEWPPGTSCDAFWSEAASCSSQPPNGKCLGHKKWGMHKKWLDRGVGPKKWADGPDFGECNDNGQDHGDKDHGGKDKDH